MTTIVAHHEALLIAEYGALAAGGALWAVVRWIRSLRR